MQDSIFGLMEDAAVAFTLRIGLLVFGNIQIDSAVKRKVAHAGRYDEDQLDMGRCRTHW